MKNILLSSGKGVRAIIEDNIRQHWPILLVFFLILFGLVTIPQLIEYIDVSNRIPDPERVASVNVTISPYPFNNPYPLLTIQPIWQGNELRANK